MTKINGGHFCIGSIIIVSPRKLFLTIMYINQDAVFRSTDHYFRVRMGHGKLGKSWNFTISFSRSGKSWNLSMGHGKSWKMTEK